MLFKFGVVCKVNDRCKYRVGGVLEPEEADKGLFADVRDAYKEYLSSNNMNFGDNLIIKDTGITFTNIALDDMVNVLTLLSHNLDFEIKPVVDSSCNFVPQSCEPLFKMEIHRLFK